MAVNGEVCVYPEIEPYDCGLLAVGDGNSIYWECCGNPHGQPAIYLHGGPGSGAAPWARRYFDPEKYKIVLLDQRGCGRSRPLLNDRSQLRSNTTHHLIDDIEALRKHLRIERWVMLGTSWGSTVALAYAQAFPERISAVVLACVTTTSRREVDWITEGVGPIFPQQWERFVEHIPPSLKGERIVDAYARLLFDDDPSVCAAAAAEWCAGYVPNPRFKEPDFRLRFARFVTHYWRHSAFLRDDQLLHDAGALSAVPAVLLHGRYDVSSPLDTAWRLHKRWPHSELHIIDDAGHGGGSLAVQTVAALNRLARKLR